MEITRYKAVDITLYMIFFDIIISILGVISFGVHYNGLNLFIENQTLFLFVITRLFLMIIICLLAYTTFLFEKRINIILIRLLSWYFCIRIILTGIFFLCEFMYLN